jgi:hypothetical protein
VRLALHRVRGLTAELARVRSLWLAALQRYVAVGGLHLGAAADGRVDDVVDWLGGQGIWVRTDPFTAADALDPTGSPRCSRRPYRRRCRS